MTAQKSSTSNDLKLYLREAKPVKSIRREPIQKVIAAMCHSYEMKAATQKRKEGEKSLDPAGKNTSLSRGIGYTFGPTV
jgi:hypothetical protein